MATAKVTGKDMAKHAATAADQAKTMAGNMIDRIEHSTTGERLVAGAAAAGLAAGAAVAAYAVSKSKKRPTTRQKAAVKPH